MLAALSCSISTFVVDSGFHFVIILKEKAPLVGLKDGLRRVRRIFTTGTPEYILRIVFSIDVAL